MRERTLYVDLQNERCYGGSVVQFDHGLKLVINGLTPSLVNMAQFHFTNANMDKAITVIPEIVDYHYVVDIPDVILLSPRDFICYVYQEGSNDDPYGLTQYTISFKVYPRQKPEVGTVRPIDNYEKYIANLDKITDDVYIAIESKADRVDTKLETTLSMGRKGGTNVGEHSTALGFDVEASGNNTFATGGNTTANISYMSTVGHYNRPGTLYTNFNTSTPYRIGDCAIRSEKYYRCIRDTSGEWKSADWVEIDYEGNELFVVGNGYDSSNRSNALTVLNNGDVVAGRDLYAGDNKIATENYVSNQISSQISDIKLVQYGSCSNAYREDGVEIVDAGGASVIHPWIFEVNVDSNYSPNVGDLLIVRFSQNMLAPDPTTIEEYHILLSNELMSYKINNMKTNFEENSIIFAKDQYYIFRYIGNLFEVVSYSSGSSSSSSQIDLENYTTSEINTLWTSVFG